MYGATIGALNIYFKQENLLPRLMFTKEGDQGNQWLHGIFNLPKAKKGFQVMERKNENINFNFLFSLYFLIYSLDYNRRSTRQ